MLTILLGKDVFAKEHRIQKELLARKADKQVFKEGDVLPDLRTLSGATLFGPEKIFIFQHCLSKLDHDLLLNFVPHSTACVFLIEDSLDKRKSVNQSLINSEVIKVEEYQCPTVDDAVAWLLAHAIELGAGLDNATAKFLYRRLSPNEEDLDVLSAHNEILKLKGYADRDKITEGMITELVGDHTTIDIFSLLDCITSKQKGKAMQMLETYFDISGGDEKAKAIQLTSMIGDQMRNLLIVKDADEQRMPESALMKLTGWKSGRIFVLRKLSKGMTVAKIEQTLSKLEKLDLEMKSGGLPQHVVLDVIIAGM